MRAPPARRFVQVGLPLAFGALIVIPLWLSRPGVAPGGSTAPPSSNPSAQPTDGALPTLSGPTLSGAAFDSGSLRGHVTIVNFWNPDCPPCAREAPAIARAWSELRSGGVRFVGVMYVGGTWPDDRDAARSFVARYGLDYPVVVDDGSSIAREAAIPGIPVTVVADTNGVMRYRIVGPLRAGQLESLVGRLRG